MSVTRILNQEQRTSLPRNKRDSLLAECDWTQHADAPVDKAVWATYRQALRDVPSQPNYPSIIVWPIKP